VNLASGTMLSCLQAEEKMYSKEGKALGYLGVDSSLDLESSELLSTVWQSADHQPLWQLCLDLPGH
jgi:hypothetical protein